MRKRTHFLKITFLIMAAIFVGLFSVSFSQADKYQLSTHILDINKGEPARGVKVELYKISDASEWVKIDSATTDMNGRIATFLQEGKKDNRGIYKLIFYVEPYLKSEGQKSIYPFIEIVFKIEDDVHYHIPLTLSANGYSTYRGN